MISGHNTADRQQLIDRALERISHISLTGARLKLGDAKEGNGWDETQLHNAEREYRRFLALLYAYPECTIVPDKMVDQFWHQHILDTRAYADDTIAVFGQFLHHFPYLGMRGPADEERLRQCFHETKKLYELHFGEDGLQGSYSTCSDTCSRCTSA